MESPQLKPLKINSWELKEKAKELRAGTRILLSGTVYTSRDAAHKRIIQNIHNGIAPPFPLEGATIYYAGPTQAPDNLPIGACGPTTSSRMDVFTPELLSKGLVAMIGKGERNKAVCNSIKENKAVYLCALGGAGALACKCITSCEVIAFEDLGCESVKKLTFENFPLFVTIDCVGGNLFEQGKTDYQKTL